MWDKFLFPHWNIKDNDIASLIFNKYIKKQTSWILHLLKQTSCHPYFLSNYYNTRYKVLTSEKQKEINIDTIEWLQLQQKISPDKRNICQQAILKVTGQFSKKAIFLML